MSAEAVRLFWEQVEARNWDAVAARLDEGVVVDWPHTGERLRPAATTTSRCSRTTPRAGTLTCCVSSSPAPASFSLQAEGDASEEAVTAEGSVAFGDGSISGKLAARPHDFFLNVMGSGTEPTRSASPTRKRAGSSDVEADEFWRDLQTPEGIRRHFDTLFTGEVSEGADGTWRFEGRLNAEGFADLTERYGAEQPTRRDRELLGQLADGTHVVLVVGRDDSLPRRLELRFEPPALDAEFDSSEHEDLDAYEASFVLELSEFGKEVEAAPPADYRPFEKLFSGFGS